MQIENKIKAARLPYYPETGPMQTDAKESDDETGYHEEIFTPFADKMEKGTQDARIERRTVKFFIFDWIFRDQQANCRWRR